MSHDHVEHGDHSRNVDNSLLGKAKRIFPLVPVSRDLSRVSRKTGSDAHKLQYQEELGAEVVYDSGKHLHQHEYEFQVNSDLVRSFNPWFTNFHVLETVFPQPRNFYFLANDSAVGQ